MKIKSLIIISIFSLAHICHSNAQNNCLDFDGSNDYINCGTINLSGSAITLEGWINADNFTNPGAGCISLFGTESGSGHTALLRLGDGGLNLNKLQFVIDIGGQKKLNGSIVLQPNTWYHVAGVYDGSNMKIYVNGVLDVSSSQSGSLTSNSSFLIGAITAYSDSRYFTGMMDEVRVWNDARTVTEIRQNMYQELSNPASETNLLAYYQLNETSGTSADNAEGTASYDGTLTNMAGNEWETSSAMFGPKNCLEFDGYNDYVAVSTLSSAFTQGTISFWIKPKATPANNARVLSDHWDDDEIYLASGVGKVATWHMIDGDELMSSNALPNNEWTHVAITMDNTSSKLYINGVLDDESGPSETVISSTIEIGGYSTSGNPEVVNGYLDEFRIWSDVRTEQEIREYMCKNLTGNEADLLVYYSFDNTSGTTLQDFSGNGNDGTLTNMTDADWVSSSAFNTWLNTSSSSWSTASNWSRGSVPASTSPYDNIGVFSYSGGTDLSVSGTPTLSNFVLGSSSALALSSGMTVNSSLIVGSDLDLNGQTITLGSSATMFEDGGRIYGSSGQIQTTRTLNDIDENVAGLGAEITEDGNLGLTTIVRKHESLLTLGLERTFQITSTNSPSSASLVLHFDENELNNCTEANMKLYKSSDGSSWTEQSSSTINTTNNTLSLTGINSFSYWTAGELGNGIQPAGSGTENDPYLIASLGNLLWISENSSSWKSCFLQTEDINASSTSDWFGGAGFIPIGSESGTHFEGYYEGNSHIISNLYIYRPSTKDVGLFGYTDRDYGQDRSYIRNLGLENVDFTGGYRTGGIGGRIMSNVSYCYVTGSITGTAGNSVAAGLAAQSHYTISDCYSRASVSAVFQAAGFVSFNNGVTENCYSTGAVSDASDLDGFCNDADGHGDGTLSNSFWDTQTSGQSGSDGGTGKTTSQMKTQTTFSSWDFVASSSDGTDDIWDMASSINNGYPFLKSQATTITWAGTSSTSWSTASNWSGSLDAPSEYKNVVIATSSNDPVVSSSIECKDLTINSGASVNIAYNGELTINGDLTNNAGNTGLIIKSTSSGTGSLITEGDINGNVTVERYVDGSSNGKYHYLSSPIQSATGASLNADYNMYEYQDSLKNWKRIFSGDALVPGIGYIAAYGSAKTLSFTGELNNGTIHAYVNSSNTNATYDDYSLLGNPYPCRLDAAKFFSDNTNLNGTIYLWDDDGTAANYGTADYASWNSLGSVSSNSSISPTQYIEVGQAFAVQATTAGTVVFEHDQRVHNDAAAFFVPETESKRRIWLDMNHGDSEVSNEILIGFVNTATTGFDRLYDGEKRQGNEYLSFYSLMDDKALVIQGLPELKESTQIPLGYFAKLSGEYSIQIDSMENLEDFDLYLIDKESGKQYDLLEGSYVFTTGLGQYDDRFELSISKSSSDIEENSLEDVVVFSSHDQVFVKGAESGTQLSLYDLLGNCLLEKEIQNSFDSLKLPGAQAYYILRLSSNSQTISKKVLLK
jgi:hypothetical protein